MTDVLDLFNCLVLSDHHTLKGVFHPGNAYRGVVTDFVPNHEQASILAEKFEPLPLHTFFTREERESASIEHLWTKQVLHYIEVYGLEMPGLFNLTAPHGEVVVMRYVHGITLDELCDMVQALLYTNAPIKDTVALRRIIGDYGIDFDINKVQNNEMRVLLYRPGVDTFKSGDDAVRYMCYRATGDSLLIKSKEVIRAVTGASLPASFFVVHEVPLAQVFNRHKRLILAAKNKKTATAINRIARLSKKAHVPILPPVSKIFIHKALSNPSFKANDVLEHTTLRDKFNFLNVLARKWGRSSTASFRIRNGKVWVCGDRPVYPIYDIDRVEDVVLDALSRDLHHLRKQNILLDKSVDYGLPISRKQTIGNLPFGTKVQSSTGEIASGMYWENAWGATDLDLSTIDEKGSRVGWGSRRGYQDRGILFSGDITHAPDGAMEFMLSSHQTYGLFMNIYVGDNSPKMELVVGEAGEGQWIKNALVREEHILQSRNSIIGFVKDDTYVVYAGRFNDNRVSSVNPVTNEMAADFWTIQSLFGALSIPFAVDRDPKMEYNYDLSYGSFSFDKLEDLFRTAT